MGKTSLEGSWRGKPWRFRRTQLGDSPQGKTCHIINNIGTKRRGKGSLWASTDWDVSQYEQAQGSPEQPARHHLAWNCGLSSRSAASSRWSAPLQGALGPSTSGHDAPLPASGVGRLPCSTASRLTLSSQDFYLGLRAHQATRGLPDFRVKEGPRE